MSIKKLYRKGNLFLKKTKNEKQRNVIFISLIILLSFILFYAGHFLFSALLDGKKPMDSAVPQETSSARTSEKAAARTAADAVKYIHRTEVINGLKQEIFMLEVDPAVQGIRIQPVLSHDVIYGFELLSEMAARKKAYAAVTGGFFSKYGLPSGMVVINGELIAASTGKYPVFTVENGKAALKDFKSSIMIEYGRGNKAGSTGGERSGADEGNANAAPGNTAADNAATVPGNAAGFPAAGNLAADRFNSPEGPKSIAVYTPYYGRTNRAQKPNITVTVKDGTVTGAAYSGGETEIPRNGFLISFFDTTKYSEKNLPLKVGDPVKVVHQPEIGADTDAYECGSWLVRGGESVAPLKDAWVGVLTNRDPRTAIGIKENGAVVLLTVDGRQPGYSAGFTGRELADYLIGCGVKDAAMLDGGASAEMLVEGKLVSRPSYKGEERTLGGGMLVLTGE